MQRVAPSRYHIYGLLDPRDQSLCYIGKTHKRREIRLREHIQAAMDGRKAPVYVWIRELLEANLQPSIFVLEKLPGGSDWREAEQRHIAQWRSPENVKLPYHHPPQTPKSKDVTIASARLRNVTKGGEQSPAGTTNQSELSFSQVDSE